MGCPFRRSADVRHAAGNDGAALRVALDAERPADGPGRYAMTRSPIPLENGMPGGMPTPSSVIVRTSWLPARRRSTVTFRARPCRMALLTASWAMRYRFMATAASCTRSGWSHRNSQRILKMFLGVARRSTRAAMRPSASSSTGARPLASVFVRSMARLM